MTYAERVCACGCGRRFWPRQFDQKFAGPWCRAAAWRRAHAQTPPERLADPARTNASSDGRESFTEDQSGG